MCIVYNTIVYLESIITLFLLFIFNCFCVIIIIGDCMKHNNKGFTMVELLVAMAIMGLLIIMAFPTIRAIQTNNTNKKYEEYGKAAISAAKLYTDSYGEDMFIGSSENQAKVLDLNDLVKKDLLKDINVSGSTCLNGSSVIVVKYNDDYTYCLHLKCTAINSNAELYSDVNENGICSNIDLYNVTYKYTGHPDKVFNFIISY